METFAQIEGVFYPVLSPNLPNNGHVFAFPDDVSFHQASCIVYVDDSIDIEYFAH